MNSQLGLLHDIGSPSVLAGTRLADAFRYWQGRSGRQYLFRIAGIGDLTETYDHVVLVARKGDDGRRQAVWIGMGGTLDAFAEIEAALARGNCELHIHALAETMSARGAVIDDLRAAGVPVPEAQFLLAAA
ncbi:MAG: hypothetical protein AB7O39_16955 [Flavobacteriaceae bacterium]